MPGPSATPEVPLSAGRPAPSFVLHDGAGAAWSSPRGGAWVLAFARRWSPEREPELAAVRAQLRGLAATLIVITDAGAWWFEAGVEHPRFVAPSPRFADDRAAVAGRYGVAPGTDAAFLVDDGGVIRFAHVPALRLALALPLALGAATAAVMQPRRQATRALVRALERAAAA